MSDTPQTDAMALSDSRTDYNWRQLCRRLERERDEAQATLTDIHRWIERNHPDGFIDSLTFHQNLERVGDRWYDRLDKIKRERDEAIAARKASAAEWREQISNAEKRVKAAQEIAARALIQRDEILKALEK